MVGEMRVNLQGRRALVTGGRRGIGKAIVLAMARSGAEVFAVGLQPDVELEKAAYREGWKVRYVIADLTDREARAHLIDAVNGDGGLDILVNNAGVQVQAPLCEYTLDQWDLDLELLTTATFHLSQGFSPKMIERGRGRIINISSISGFQGARNIVGYTTAKHAVIGLTKALGNELGPAGITVNAIAPGICETDMAKDVFENKEKSEVIKGRIPLGRFAQPDDVAGPVLFLCSDAAAYIHGQTLLVDGGWLAR